MGAENEILAIEDEMWRANRAGDGGFYARELREDAMVVSKWGVLGREAIIAGITANHNPYLKTDLSDRKVVFVNEDAALVTYRADVVALVDGAEVPVSSYATSVYAREDGRWRSVFHQQTAL